jgi:hypothetical protein
VNNVARAFFIADLFVLGFAFFSSALAGVGTIGEEWRTVGVLKFNPNDVTQWVRVILILGSARVMRARQAEMLNVWLVWLCVIIWNGRAMP